MSDIEIDDFKCNYHVQARCIDVGKIQDRLDSVVNNLLSKEHDRIASTAFYDDNSIFFIKDLKIDFSLNIARQDNRVIAELWAKRIASAVKSTLISSGQKNNMVRFANKSDYLASFIVDLLNGVAWKKWYYQEFEQLKKFNTRGLVKELLSQSSEIVEDILLLITEKNSLDELLKELREEDIKIIYEDYIDNRKKQEKRALKELIRILTKKLDESSLVLPGEKFSGLKNYLSLYLRTLQSYPELKSVVNMKKAVKLTFLLREFLREYEGTNILRSAIEKGDMNGFLSFVQTKGTGELSGVIKEAIVLEEKSGLLDIVRGLKEKADSASRDKTITPFGGLFILIRPVLEAKLHLLIEGSSFPCCDSLSRTNTFLLFLAQIIAGQKKLVYEGIDPGLILFAGYKNPPNPGRLKEFTQAVTPEMNSKFLNSLSKLFSKDFEALKEDMHIKQKNTDFTTVLEVIKNLIFKIFSGKLNRFENSSPEYIFKNFIQRRSEIMLNQELIQIKLSRNPLDVVLRMSGLIEDVERVPWHGNRGIKFILGK